MAISGGSACNFLKLKIIGPIEAGLINSDDRLQ